MNVLIRIEKVPYSGEWGLIGTHCLPMDGFGEKSSSPRFLAGNI